MFAILVCKTTPNLPPVRWTLSNATATRCAIWFHLCAPSPGLDITDEQLEEMRREVDNIDWDYAAKKEAEFRHDVMGHIHAFGHVCPKVLLVVHHTTLSTTILNSTKIIHYTLYVTQHYTTVDT